MFNDKFIIAPVKKIGRAYLKKNLNILKIHFFGKVLRLQNACSERSAGLCRNLSIKKSRNLGESVFDRELSKIGAASLSCSRSKRERDRAPLENVSDEPLRFYATNAAGYFVMKRKGIYRGQKKT